MRQSFLKVIKYWLIVSLIVPLLAACGITSTIEDNYPLESVSGSGSQTSYVYRAADLSVSEVARHLLINRSLSSSPLRRTAICSSSIRIKSSISSRMRRSRQIR